MRQTRIHHSARVGGEPEDLTWLDGPQATHKPEIGEGVWINAYATVDSGTRRPTRVGDRSTILAHAHLGHDVEIGEDTIITTGAIIGGHATIGSRVKVGLGAIVLPFRQIGDGATIGAGAVVTKDVRPGATVVGNPAHELGEGERNPLPHSERALLAAS